MAATRKVLKECGYGWVEKNTERLIEHAKEIWAYAELALEEEESARAHVRFLEEHGFSVTTPIAGIGTAFLATWGKGKPIIGLNCEYDALPGLSQASGTPNHKPIVPGAPGHGCGHNLLGTGSLAAAVATKCTMEVHGLTGTLCVIGAPGEELCAGKAFMAREGALDGFDAIVDWHPSVGNSVIPATCNAYFSMKYHFRGRTSHGNSPWEGRSALDAAMLAGHAVEMLREHIPPAAPPSANTINYTISDAGPEYPNVVPDRATVWCIGRLQTSELMADVRERVHHCFEGAALAVGCELTKEFITATHEMIPNSVLAGVMHRNAVEIGPPSYTDDEEAFAKALQGSANSAETGMDRSIQPFAPGSVFVTDSSEYSWLAPTSHAALACAPPGIGWHNWQVAACSNASLGFKGMCYASKVLFATAVDLLIDNEVITKAKAEWASRLSGRNMSGLLPDNARAPLGINRKVMDQYRPLLEKAGNQ